MWSLKYCGRSSPRSRRSLSFACAMSRATIIGPVSESRVATGWLRELGEDLAHRPAQVDPHHLGRRGRRRSTSGRYCAGIGLELLEEDALARDLAVGLAVGRARDAEPDRTRRAVARQPDHAHVVREVLAAELRADPDRRGRAGSTCSSSVAVAERAAVLVAGRRQVVERVAARELHGLERELGRGAADRRSRGGRAGTPRCRACGSSRRGSAAASRD